MQNERLDPSRQTRLELHCGHVGFGGLVPAELLASDLQNFKPTLGSSVLSGGIGDDVRSAIPSLTFRKFSLSLNEELFSTFLVLDVCYSEHLAKTRKSYRCLGAFFLVGDMLDFFFKLLKFRFEVGCFEGLDPFFVILNCLGELS